MNIQIERMEKVLDRYFVGDKTLFYSPPDVIAKNNYLRYGFVGNDKSRVLISAGSDDGEVQLKICTTDIELENTIKTLIY